MAEVTELQAYRRLLQDRFYFNWRATLDSDVFDEDQIVILAVETVEIDDRTKIAFREFLGVGMDTFHFIV